MYTVSLFVWTSEISLFGVGKVGVSASLREGIMNELLGHQNLCSVLYLPVVRVGSGMGGLFGR